MYKLIEGRHIYAGTNEFYRWGHKAVEKAQKALEPNDAGFYTIKADGGKYWTIGTSTGKYGEYAKYGNDFLSVNKAGNVWAKVGTPKADVFIAMVNRMIDDMRAVHAKQAEAEEEDED